MDATFSQCFPTLRFTITGLERSPILRHPTTPGFQFLYTLEIHRNTVYLESGNVADGLSHFSCDRVLEGLKEFGGGVSNLVRGAAFQVVSQNWSHPNLMASFG